MWRGQPLLLAIKGPTASGKTALAIQVAQYLATEVVSVDSRQVYREMDIGVARPSAGELAAVPHHFVASHSVHRPLTAAAYAEEALPLLKEMLAKKRFAVAAGGSMLYYRALLGQLDEVPVASEETKARVQQLWQEEGMAGWQRKLRETDPDYYAKVDVRNPRRLQRALEVILETGKPYSLFVNQKTEGAFPFKTVHIHLMPEREWLYQRINQRADTMLEIGLLEEVERLFPHRRSKALQTVGYQEFFAWKEGQWDYGQAVEKLKQNTRRYAKRQYTWLRAEQPDITLEKPELGALLNGLDRLLRP